MYEDSYFYTFTTTCIFDYSYLGGYEVVSHVVSLYSSLMCSPQTAMSNPVSSIPILLLVILRINVEYGESTAWDRDPLPNIVWTFLLYLPGNIASWDRDIAPFSLRNRIAIKAFNQWVTSPEVPKLSSLHFGILQLPCPWGMHNWDPICTRLLVWALGHQFPKHVRLLWLWLLVCR